MSLKSPSPYRQIHVQHNSQIFNELSKCFNLFQSDMRDGEEMFDRSTDRIKIRPCAGAQLIGMTISQIFDTKTRGKYVPLTRH